MIPKTHDLFDKLFASRTDLCDKYPSCPSTSPLLPFPYAPLLLVYKKLTLHIYGSDFVKITKPGMLPEIWDNKEYNPIKLCLDPGNLPPLLFSLPSLPSRASFPSLNAYLFFSPPPLPSFCFFPGDFAMWDSRTAHCNHPASPQAKLPAPDIRRLVGYVCMTPLNVCLFFPLSLSLSLDTLPLPLPHLCSHVVQQAKKNRKVVVEERLTAFRDGLTTSHWYTLLPPLHLPPSPLSLLPNKEILGHTNTSREVECVLANPSSS